MAAGSDYQSYLNAVLAAQGIGGGSPTSTVSKTVSKTTGVTPEQEAAAYKTAYGNVLTPEGEFIDKNFGGISDEQLSGYFNLRNPYLFGQGMQGINQALGAAGFGPAVSGPVGPQAEMAGRLQAQLGAQQGMALAENAAKRANWQGMYKQGVGGTRYAALTGPNRTTESTTTQEPKGGGTAVIPSPSWVNPSGGSRGVQQGAQNAWWAGEPAGGWGGGTVSSPYTAPPSPADEAGYGALPNAAQPATGDSGYTGTHWNPQTGQFENPQNPQFAGTPWQSGYGQLGAF